MDANAHEYPIDELDRLVEKVVGASYEVANTLGCGFLEKVYERALAKELKMRGVTSVPQVRYPVLYKGEPIGEYLADLVVEQQLIVEVKCVESFATEHLAQCINYLKASGLHLAVLVNFQHPRVQWKRVVHSL
jgi:GxxExxY protein